MTNKEIRTLILVIIMFIISITTIICLGRVIYKTTMEVESLKEQLGESKEYELKLEKEIELLIENNAILLDKHNELESKLERSKSQSKVTRGSSKSTLEFVATAYCPCEICCGKWSGGNTKSGTIPKEGRTIAVDPNVIPLGSKVIVNGTSYIAEDTGSAIKGNMVDIFFNNHQEALNWGRQKVRVEVIKN